MASEAQAFDVSLKEQKEISEIYSKLREAEAKLIGPNGKSEILPNNLYSFLLRVLADLRAGNAVTILQSSHELPHEGSDSSGLFLGLGTSYAADGQAAKLADCIH